VYENYTQERNNMKRVQIILEEWQQQWLADEAKRQNVSMSALLRQMLTQAIERRQTESWEDDPLWGIVGLAEGPDDGITSENLDKFTYQTNWRNRPVLKVAEDDPNNR
jgi:post-segregation antitoxin (ccd killing protein)